MELFHLAILLLTRRCDLACGYCGIKAPTNPVAASKLGHMDQPVDFWMKAIDRLAPITSNFLLQGGEVTLYKGLEEIISRLAAEKKSFSIASNCYASAEDYARYHELGLPALCVSIDSLTGKCIDKSGSTKSSRGYDRLLKLDKIAPKLTKLVATAVTSQNIDEIPSLIQRFSERGWISLPCLVQSSEGYLGDSAVASKSTMYSPWKSKILELADQLIEHHSEWKLGDPIDYYKTWKEDALWHCDANLRTPTIDADGKMWACLVVMGTRSPKFNVLDADWDKYLEAMMKDCLDCPGCRWNCQWTSNAITSGLVPPSFWV